MQGQKQHNIENELDEFVKASVKNGVAYDKLEEWMDQWEELSGITGKYKAEEIYKAFHQMPLKIKKYTGLINGEEMYFVSDKLHKDHKEVKLELVKLLDEQGYRTLVDVEQLKYMECKQLVKHIRFERELPVHLRNILIENKSIKTQLNEKAIQFAKGMTDTSKQILNSAGQTVREAYSWLKKQELKEKSINASNEMAKVTKSIINKLSAKLKGDVNNLKEAFLEAKKKNFGINFTEVKNNVTNVVFYSFLGGFLMLLMLINL